MKVSARTKSIFCQEPNGDARRFFKGDSPRKFERQVCAVCMSQVRFFLGCSLEFSLDGYQVLDKQLKIFFVDTDNVTFLP
jgi:hypothetical protein